MSRAHYVNMIIASSENNVHAIDGDIDAIEIHDINILIYYGAIHSYNVSNVVERCHLKKRNLEISILVQLDTGTKRKVTEAVRKCPLEMNGLNTFAELNIIPLGSYDVFIGMNWLDAHQLMLYCHNKIYTCLMKKAFK